MHSELESRHHPTTIQKERSHERPPQIGCIAVSPVIPVPDIVKATDFYRDQLGFEVRFIWDNPPSYAAVDYDTHDTYRFVEA